MDKRRKHDTANLIHMPNGRYKVRYRDPNNFSRSKTFERKTDARAFLSAVQADKQRGVWVDPNSGRKTVGEMAVDWRAGRVHVRKATSNLDETLLRVHVLPAFGRVQLRNVERADVQKWVNSLAIRYSRSTVTKCYRILAGIMREAVDERLVTESPCNRIRFPREDRAERRYLDPSAIARLIDATPERHRAIVQTAIYLGCRWEELAGLKRTNLDLLRHKMSVVGTIERDKGRYNYVTETKTNAGRRTLSLPPFIINVLARHLETAPPSEYVFPAQEGGFLRYDNFRTRVWNPSVKRAGLDGLTFHELRHTCAALLIQEGANPLEIQRRLGHSDIKTTLGTYGHLFPNQEERLNDALTRVFENVAELCPEPTSDVLRMTSDLRK